ncbi:MAG: Na/Pi cotransporter family protein [Thermodesulfobacteriota bacterium]
MTSLMLLNLFGGISFLLYGMRLAGDGLKKSAGTRLRDVLMSVTDRRLKAVGIGAVITALFQSSSATTVMLVGFVGSGLISLSQTMGIILGADIGTTFTVQVIAFKVYDYALFLVGIGVVMFFQKKRPTVRAIGQGILGFAIIFLSLKMLTEAFAPLAENRLFRESIISFSSDPLMGIILAAILTAVLHSSAATIGLALTMAHSGLISIHASIPIILGANIGTCVSALTSSIGANTDAKRVAVAHTLFKIIGVLIILPFLTPFASVVSLTASGIERQIANAHTIFNLLITFIFIPFTVPFTRLVQAIVPEEMGLKKEKFSAKYLDSHVLSSPSLAIGQAIREAIRMSDLIREMLRDSIRVFKEDDIDLLKRIERRDDDVDLLDREIKLYLTKLTKEALSDEQAEKELEIIALTSDLENIGDVIDKNLMELAKKKINNRLVFSKEGLEEIDEFHRMVMENYELGISTFASGDIGLARKLLKRKISIADKERSLREAHIMRLHKGLKESIDTSSIHLDILTNLKRINSYVSSIAYPLVRKTEEEWSG